MENLMIDQNMGDGRMTITPEIKTFLKETAKWGKFLAIVGFVGIGFMVLFGLFFGTVMSKLSPMGTQFGAAEAAPAAFMTIIYILMAALYFMPCLYLYRFATKMQVALKADDQGFLTTSFENLKSCYKFFGIFMAIVLGLYAVMLVIGLLFGGMAAFM